MAVTTSRRAYHEAGLEILSELGYGGLKLAEVCRRLGVTTGSFYHFFANWSTYTGELLEYWVQVRTVEQIEFLRSVPDPRDRVGKLMEIGMGLPHGTEAAIRTWASTNPQVHAVQAQVEEQRYTIIYESGLALLGDHRQAEVFARWTMYVLVGYEQTLLPRDSEALSWISQQVLDMLDSGKFDSVPH